MAGMRLASGRGVRAFRGHVVSVAVLFGVLVVASGATAHAVHKPAHGASKASTAAAALSPVAANATPVALNAYVAFSQAKALNRQVIVKDQTTKTTTVYANPSVDAHPDACLWTCAGAGRVVTDGVYTD